MKPAGQHSMGWRELNGWSAAMNRQLNPPTADPDSWDNREQDPFWQQVKADREKRIRESLGR